MKKSIVIVMAVAIIGALGIYGKSHGSSTAASTGAGNSSTLGANTAGTNSSSSSESSGSNSSGSSSSATFKDGTYSGASEDTPYGTVQIAVVISGGKITDVNFLQMPYLEGHSQEVTSYSEPLLKQETIQKQSASIDFVSGATSTSEGYAQSLQYALNQAA